MAASPCRIQEVGEVARELLVVPVLGVGCVEVLGVIVAERLRQRDDRRVDDVGQTAAGILELEFPL